MKNKSQKAITQPVDRGFALHEQISLLTEEIKTIKTQLKTEAFARRSEHLPFLDKDSEGTQWIVVTKDCECRIVFPDRKIKTEFEPSESDFLTIRSLSGDRFKDLFQKATVYRPAERKTFRCQVNHLLPTGTAKQLLELCINPLNRSRTGNPVHRVCLTRRIVNRKGNHESRSTFIHELPALARPFYGRGSGVVSRFFNA